MHPEPQLPRPVPRRFSGRRVVLAGGGRGIGEATARRFAAEDADVLLVARTATEIEAVAASIVAEGGRASAHVADVASIDQVDETVAVATARMGGIDVLVNCAGIDHDCPFLDFPVAEWERVLAVNLTGAFLMAQRVARVMAAGGGGAIVHVAFLSSDDAAAITGSELVVDGGTIANLYVVETLPGN